MNSLTFNNILNRLKKHAVKFNISQVGTDVLLYTLVNKDPVVQHIITRQGLSVEQVKNNLNIQDNRGMTHVDVSTMGFSPELEQLIYIAITRKTIQSSVTINTGEDVYGIDIFMAMLMEPVSVVKQLFNENQIDNMLFESMGGMDEPNPSMAHDGAMGNEQQSIVEQYCTNLNEEAKNGNIDPLIGRHEELAEVAAVLGRKKKNNLIFVGDAGVGKTAIAEGLAYNIVNGNVNDGIKDAEVFLMETGSLLAGTKFRGEFEERVKNLITELEERNNAILCIDEIHSMMGAGTANNGGVDMSNMLKPALARGKIRVLGTTTGDEFRKNIEKDSALTRRFKVINVAEPTLDEAKEILSNLQPIYEKYHNVSYDDGVVDAIVELTHKYMMDRRLPDKAIDIVDGVAARMRSVEVDQTKTLTVTMKDAEKEISRIAKIPEKDISDNSTSKLASLKDRILGKVFGQDSAVEVLTDSICVSEAGLRDSNKTIGNYLMVGPTGVGKTEVAKALSQELGKDLVRYDMSEYMEKGSISKLIGTSAGYVGYDDEGQLIKDIQDHPNGCILLLDEIEKAHPSIYNLFLQVMDDGRITSSKGKTLSCRNVVVLMTSNAGSAAAEQSSLGFITPETKTRDNQDAAVSKVFTPEFRNRLDAVLYFDSLDKNVIGMVVDKFIKELNELAGQRGVSVKLDNSAKEWIIKKGYNVAMGARPMGREIHDHIKKPLSKMMLFGELSKGGTLNVSVKNDKIFLEAKPVSTPVEV